MYRLILVLSMLVFAASGTALAQQTSKDFAAVIPAMEADSKAASASAAAPGTSVSSTEARLRTLRTLVPKSDVHLVTRLAMQLRARDAADREQALKEIIYYVSHYGDLVDLSSLSPRLLNVFATDRNPSNRIMAAHGIGLLGDVEANIQLMEMARRDGSAHVRRLATVIATSVIHDSWERS